MTGTWIGEGYSCEKGGLVEQVQLSINGNYLVAKKITGDNCVPAGNITFQGTLPDSLVEGISFPVTWTVGIPTNPASSKTVQSLTILNANSFSSSGAKFTRNSKQESCRDRVIPNQSGDINSDGYDGLIAGTKVKIGNFKFRVCPEMVIHGYGDEPDEKLPAQFEMSYEMSFKVLNSQAANTINQTYSTVNNVVSSLIGFLASKLGIKEWQSALVGFGASEALGRLTHSWQRGDILTTTYNAEYDPISRLTTITETEKLEGDRQESGKVVHKVFEDNKTTYQDSTPPFSYD